MQMLSESLDFGAFFTQVIIAGLMERLSIVSAVCTNDTFAEQCFKAYSGKAKLRIIARLCTEPNVEVG